MMTPRKTKFQIKTLNGKGINAERAENYIFVSFYVRATTHQGHINKIANMSSSESVAQSVTQVPSLALRDGIKGEICSIYFTSKITRTSIITVF